ncbi:MAG: D-alanyl-D-alanine carboxypeptidase [Clostridia bacterium]|nr:D-alanyl-D-alanine carboxypeptidase [Clostridia bacterium]
MSNRRSPILLLLLVALMLPCFSFHAYAVSGEPLSVSAQSAVLIEAGSGAVVYEKNAETRLPMASTTKIMTALVAARLAPLDTEIQIDAGAVGVEGSSIYLCEGEILSLEELLYALLLESANDAATAIAIGLSGSVEAFCAEMNREAESLGLTDTHFVNPHGLDHGEHYTTAHELALIARALLENETLAEIVSTQKKTVTTADPAHTRYLANHNRLLRMYDGCIGVKTGYTKRSGRCLVSAAERDGVRLIAVTLNAPNDWQDHSDMLDYGFTQYRSVLLCDAEEYRLEVPVVGGTTASLTVCNAQELRVTLPNRSLTVKTTVELPRFLYAPIKTTESIGKVVYSADLDGDGTKEVIGEVSLIACQTVERQEQKKSLWQRLIAFFQELFSF